MGCSFSKRSGSNLPGTTETQRVQPLRCELCGSHFLVTFQSHDKPKHDFLNPFYTCVNCDLQTGGFRLGRTEVPDPDWQNRNTDNTTGDRNTQVTTGQQDRQIGRRNNHDMIAGLDPAVNVEMQNLGGFDEDVEDSAGLQMPPARSVARQHIQSGGGTRAIGHYYGRSLGNLQ